MRNRQASCCLPTIQPQRRFGAAQPISDAYNWWRTGLEPLQCSGYNCCLSIPLDVLISRDRSRQIDTAPASLSQLNTVESRLYAAVRPFSPALRGLLRASTGTRLGVPVRAPGAQPLTPARGKCVLP